MEAQGLAPVLAMVLQIGCPITAAEAVEGGPNPTPAVALRHQHGERELLLGQRAVHGQLRLAVRHRRLGQERAQAHQLLGLARPLHQGAAEENVLAQPAGLRIEAASRLGHLREALPPAPAGRGCPAPGTAAGGRRRGSPDLLRASRSSPSRAARSPARSQRGGEAGAVSAAASTLQARLSDALGQQSLGQQRSDAATPPRARRRPARSGPGSGRPRAGRGRARRRAPAPGRAQALPPAARPRPAWLDRRRPVLVRGRRVGWRHPARRRQRRIPAWAFLATGARAGGRYGTPRPRFRPGSPARRPSWRGPDAAAAGHALGIGDAEGSSSLEVWPAACWRRELTMGRAASSGLPRDPRSAPKGLGQIDGSRLSGGWDFNRSLASPE